MIYVIGSGPAAIAALAACIEKNREVTVIDVGFTAHSDFREETPPKPKSRIPVKTIYGSDYPYWDIVPKTFEKDNQSEAINSHAAGGLSNTWGAGILAYTPDEVAHWPVSYELLTDYYKKLDAFLPLVAQKDILEKDFPLFHSDYTQLNASSQFQKVLDRVEKNAQPLRTSGIQIGKSRMAIDQKKQPCTYCGKCIEGCPDRLIYSSAFTLADFMQNPLVHYKDGIQVEKISSEKEQVRIHAYDLKIKQQVFFDAEKVYVGCGTLSTTQIMMRSLEVYDREVHLKDSQYFIFPMLGAASKGILNEKVYTLAEGFCEISNASVSPHRVHLSLYGFSPFLRDYVYGVFGKLRPLLKPFLDFFLKRMYVAQGFVHSAHSNVITVTLQKNAEGTDSITIKPKIVQQVKKPIKKVIGLLNRHFKHTGLFGVAPFLQIAPTGKSFHTGASMPMKEIPADAMDTNVLGETAQLPNVHVVDASVFPDIPGGPIVFTMMANAYRIVIESLK